ncbi:AraC family ligand binding domain-containing protein [Aureimonas ureilytica]|uniref:AraC family ligand binding domain-containing protein n=1 Tax=Aureimonas ureilytica TaxID=401562 RepID=UPI00192D129F|nr:AraC family ligand binding domain-containing protein [Aureimonas ureilytica]
MTSTRETGPSDAFDIVVLIGECLCLVGYATCPVKKGCAPSQTFGRHSHEGFAIGAIAAGVGGYRLRGANVLLPQGSLSLMNPDEAHCEVNG